MPILANGFPTNDEDELFMLQMDLPSLFSRLPRLPSFSLKFPGSDFAFPGCPNLECRVSRRPEWIDAFLGNPLQPDDLHTKATTKEGKFFVTISLRFAQLKVAK